VRESHEGLLHECKRQARRKRMNGRGRGSSW
jgi:hypothetical protein